MDQIIVVSENGTFKEHTTVQLKESLTLGFDGDNKVVALIGAALHTDVQSNISSKRYINKKLSMWRRLIEPSKEEALEDLKGSMLVGMLACGFNDGESAHSEIKMDKADTAGKPLGDIEYNSPYKATVEGMLSPDYKKRFKAEYQQTKIRYDKLNAFCNRIEAAMRTCPGDTKRVQMPEHDCPLDLLHDQLRAMGEYFHCLEIRAVIEGIDLT